MPTTIPTDYPELSYGMEFWQSQPLSLHVLLEIILRLIYRGEPAETFDVEISPAQLHPSERRRMIRLLKPRVEVPYCALLLVSFFVEETCQLMDLLETALNRYRGDNA